MTAISSPVFTHAPASMGKLRISPAIVDLTSTVRTSSMRPVSASLSTISPRLTSAVG